MTRIPAAGVMQNIRQRHAHMARQQGLNQFVRFDLVAEAGIKSDATTGVGP